MTGEEEEQTEAAGFLLDYRWFDVSGVAVRTESAVDRHPHLGGYLLPTHHAQRQLAAVKGTVAVIA